MNKCIDCGKNIAKGSKRCTSCHCGRLNKARIGIPMEESVKEKLRKSAVGRIITEEAKQKMREAKLKNPTKYWSGKKRSEETKKKISEANLSNEAWNKGKSWSKEIKQKFSEIHSGKHYSRDTEFQKGTIPWNKNKFGNSIHSAHNWIKVNANKPESCEMCGSRQYLEWSNKSHKYKKDLDDWQCLCRKCHMRYDRENHGCRT